MTKSEEFERDGILWIYDITIDEVRPITQKDIHALCAVATAYGSIRNGVEDALKSTGQWLSERNPYSESYKPIQDFDA